MKRNLFAIVLLMAFFNTFFAKGAIIGPDVVYQYQEVVYSTYHKKSESLAGIISWSWHIIVVDIAKIDYGNGYEGSNYTCIIPQALSLPDTLHANFGSKDISIVENPLKLIVPDHICPTGTQLSVNASNYFDIKYTVLSSSTAKISETGLLTYDPNETRSVRVRVTVGYNGQEYGSVETYIDLQSHEFKGNYFQTQPDGMTTGGVLSLGNNNVKPGLETEVWFLGDIGELNWTSLSYNSATNISYDPSMRIFKFTPSQTLGISARFSFKYKIRGCPIEQTVVYNFPIVAFYNLSYSSGTIRVEREGEVSKNRSASMERYSVVDAMSGVIKKQGVLSSQKINEVDVSDVPDGVYVVQITSGENVNSYKLSIKK